MIRITFWTLLSLGMVVGMMYNLFEVSSKYFSYPIAVGISIEHATDLDFPAVTICNVNPVRASVFIVNSTTTGSGSSRRRRKRSATPAGNCCCKCCVVNNWTTTADACNSCLSTGDPSCSNDTPPSTPGSITTAASSPPQTSSAAMTSSTLSTTTTTETPTSTTANPLPTPPPTRQDFNNEQQLTETLATMSAQQKSALGYSMNDMILTCQYAGSNCDPKWFTEFTNPVLGNCFMFNSGWNNTQTLKSHRTGRRFGMEMIINIDQSNYVKDAGDTAGIRMVVHNGTRMPFPEDEGITVSPGHSTSVGIQKIQLDRLGKPYYECIDTASGEHDVKRNVYEELFPETYYSVAACSRTCFQSHVISKCQCGDVYYPLNGSAFGSDTQWPPCSSTNATQRDCRYGVELEYNANKLDCNCPPLCVDMLFKSHVSIGKWPSQVQMSDIFQSIASKVSFNIWDNVTYKDNLIKVEVYYEEFNFEDISQSAAYEVASFFSDIGGALGLYLGMSLMTLVEFFELFLDMLIYFIMWMRQLYLARSRQRAIAAARAAAENQIMSNDENDDFVAPLPWETAQPTADAFAYPAHHAAQPPPYHDVTRGRRRSVHAPRYRGSNAVRDLLFNM